jgi:uncharacterized membrane-anchored protein
MRAIRSALPLVPVLLFTLCLSSPAFGGETGSDGNQALVAAFRDAKWTKGPATAQLLGVADLTLPEGFGTVSGEDARRISEAMHNPTSNRDFSMVFVADGNWFLMFSFDDIGYVKDDEKGLA